MSVDTEPGPLGVPPGPSPASAGAASTGTAATRSTHAGGSGRGETGGHGAVAVTDLPLQRVNAPQTFVRGFPAAVREVWEYRELLVNLTRKELKVKYKDSVLGFLWTLVRPLLQLLVYSVAIGIFLGNSRVIPSFGVFLFTGLLAWTLFTDIIGGCTGSVVSNAGLVKKVYFPRELLPLSVVGAAVINFLLQLIVLLGAYALTERWPSPGQLGLFPMALLVTVVFATAVGLFLAASNVYLRDVQYLVEVGLLLWFWMTPIVYDWTKVRTKLVVDNPLRWVYDIYLANPIANVVLAFQRALWPAGKGTAYYYGGNLYLRLGLILVVSIGLVWLAQRAFARAQGNFAQEL